jgi:hypothetical protein
MENVGIFYYHLEYFTSLWHILWPIGIVCVQLFPFWYAWTHENPATLRWTR